MGRRIIKHRIKVIGIVLLAILGAMVVIISIGALGKYFKSLGYNGIGNVFSALIVFITILGVILFNRKVNKLNMENYGFHFKGLWRNFIVAFILALVIIGAVLISANQTFDIPISWSGLKEGYQKPLAISIIVTLMVAIWEEVFFRGLVFTTLFKNDFGFHWSAIISTLLFSLVHWSSFDMQTTSWFWYLGIVFIGYILVILYVRTNSILTPIFFHFFWNFMVDLMVYEENNIGFYTLPEYGKYSKTIDNIEVFFLGAALTLLLAFSKQLAKSEPSNI